MNVRLAETESAFGPWIMTSLIYTTTTLLLLVMMMMMMVIMIAAYSSGPPVNSEVCESMSPRSGHHVELKSSRPPFEIRSLATNNCYKAGEPITGKSLVTSTLKDRHLYQSINQSFITQKQHKI